MCYEYVKMVAFNKIVIKIRMFWTKESLFIFKKMCAIDFNLIKYVWLIIIKKKPYY